MAVLKLKTAPTVEPVTLDEVKQHCRIDGAEDDILLNSLILAARQYIEGICGPLITQTWYQYEQNFPSGNILIIQKPRLQTVSSLKYTDEDGTQSTFSNTYYTVSITEEYWPKIVLKDDYEWPTDILFNIDPITIEFLCGYGASSTYVPETIRIAILMLISHWYENREPIMVSNFRAAVMPIPITIESLLANYKIWNRE